MDLLLASLGKIAADFNALQNWQQFIYLAYLGGGVLCPVFTFRLAKAYRDGTKGIGDTDITALMLQWLMRTPALFFGLFCLPIPALPVVLSTVLDLAARLAVIRAARKAHRRAMATLPFEVANAAA